MHFFDFVKIKNCFCWKMFQNIFISSFANIRGVPLVTLLSFFQITPSFPQKFLSPRTHAKNKTDTEHAQSFMRNSYEFKCLFYYSSHLKQKSGFCRPILSSNSHLICRFFTPWLKEHKTCTDGSLSGKISQSAKHLKTSGIPGGYRLVSTYDLPDWKHSGGGGIPE